MLLEKDKLNIVKVLVSKLLINSYTSHDKFVSVNILKEYNEIKNKYIKNFSGIYCIKTMEMYWVSCKKQWKYIGSLVKNILQTKTQVSEKLNKTD